MFNINPRALGGMRPIGGRMADRAWTTGVTLPSGFKNAKMVRSIAPDRSLYIETVLSDPYADMFYRSALVQEWLTENDLSPIEFGGGVTAITIRMLEGMPSDLLRKLKFYDATGRRRRVTKEIADQITGAIKTAMALEP